MRSKNFRENASNINRDTAEKKRYSSSKIPLSYNIFACDGHKQGNKIQWFIRLL